MPAVPLVDIAGKNRSERTLSEAVFGVKPNRHLLYEAVKQFRAGQRRGTHATKTRGLVSGGGRKPWKQKGTGRAQVGSSRTPLWRGGGIVFGPQPRSYSFKLSGKVQRGALRSALSLRVSQGAVLVINDFDIEKPSSRRLRAQLDELGATKRTLLVDVKPNRELLLSARNLPGVEVRSVAALRTYEVLAARHVFLSEDAATHLEQRLGS